MTTVARIIASKPEQTVQAIEPDAPVLEAIKKMAQHGIGALLVLQGEKIVGIVSERDYARKVVLMGRSSETTPVRDIMTADVMYVSPEESNTHCMALMTENRLRHLPVLDKGKLVGLISIGDLVKDIISEQQFVIDQLEHYIRGDRG
jgi:CBS domain-containing protein